MYAPACEPLLAAPPRTSAMITRPAAHRAFAVDDVISEADPNVATAVPEPLNVEMIEAAHILRDATQRSLIIVDEIGRGTSTYDGVAVAWAVAEHIHNHVKAMTLFATHYHELTDLPQECSGMKNFNIAVKEWNDKIIFLRKLIPGGTSRSYGVEVAKLAGLPKSVIAKARQILEEWESFAAKREESLSRQMSLFGGPQKSTPEKHPALAAIEKCDPNQMTPMEALEFLASLKEQIFGRG